MRLFGVLLAVFLGTAALADEVREISVTGVATVSAEPDMAIVNVSVSNGARQAGIALGQTSAAMTSVLETLAEAGIEPRDIQTTQVGLFPLYERTNDGRPPRVTGYRATNGVLIRVRDLDALGTILDRVVTDGANELGGISFTVAEPGPLEDEARVLATQDARRRAEQLAEAAGVTLGPVLSIREGGTSGPRPMDGAVMMEARAAVPVATGEIDIRASVSMVFGIED